MFDWWSWSEFARGLIFGVTDPVWKSGEFCCEELDESIADQCMVNGTSEHFYGMCPDQVLMVTQRGVGMPVHDGGESYIEIAYCPFCGTKIARTT